ncbi:hypothetical protein BDW74DRAFT_178710 [Aspergillus multicolor]|uniref:uncharacterized protein n=1 Tax=Aspergillus multicolor TaxID=41759 RepID=UPI003CCE1882
MKARLADYPRNIQYGHTSVWTLETETGDSGAPNRSLEPEPEPEPGSPVVDPSETSWT